MSASKLKQFKALRQMCVNQMAELKTFAENTASDRDNRTADIQFKMLFKQLEDIQKNFKNHHTNILLQSASQEEFDIIEEEAVRKDFEFNSSYVRAIHYSLYETDMDTPPLTTTASSASVTNSPAKLNVKLPKLEITPYCGDLKTFRPFLDLYKSLVHDSTALSDIEKFNYLSSFLRGPPLALIQCTPMSTQNYQTAFESLVERYDNPRLIAGTPKG